MTFALDGRSSPVTVQVADPPTLPVPAAGVLLSASTGDLAGYRPQIVAMLVGATLVSMSFFRATDDELASLSAVAAAKAQKVLGGQGSRPPEYRFSDLISDRRRVRGGTAG